MKRSTYSLNIVGDIIFIYDLDGPVSVTNDAENVIEELARSGIDVDRKRIIYRDSEGRYDGLLTAKGRFAGFKLLDASSLVEAVASWVAEGR